MIIDKVGIKKTLNYSSELKEQAVKEKKGDAPILKGYLEKIIEAGIFTNESLAKAIEDEFHRPTTSLNNLENSVASNFSLQNRNSSIFTSNGYFGETRSKTALKPFGSSLRRLTNEGMSYENTTTNSMKKIDKKASKTEINSAWKPTSQNNIYFQDYAKNSHDDAGDFAASSYSVASSYLNNSESDEEASSVPKAFRHDKEIKE